MTRNAFGRTFPEPSCPYDSIVTETLWEYWPGMLSLGMAAIPVMGGGAVIASVLFSFGDANRFNGALLAWKAAVYGAVVQIVSLVVLVGVMGL